MTTVSLNDLVTVSTSDQILALELAYATALGLAVTSWEPLDPSRTHLQIQANLVAQYSLDVNLIAQGGYASYAALMTDGNGNPITTWMDLITSNVYNVIRFQPQQASGNVTLNNLSSTSQPYSPNNPLHIQYPTPGGATYTSVGSGTLLAGVSNQVVLFVADATFAGPAGNAAVGTTLALITPLPGVSVNPLTQALVGTPLESNQQVLTRSTNKLGTLSALGQIQQGTTPVPPSPAAPSSAFDFVATSIAQSPTATPSASWPYYVSALINRSRTFGNTATGIVNQYIANASGVPPGADVAVIQAAAQALALGQCQTLIVQGATPFPVTVAYTIWFKRSAGFSVAQITGAIQNALTLFFASYPIGGITTSLPNIMPIEQVDDLIFDAQSGGAVDVLVTLNGVNGNLAFPSAASVATLGVISPTVSFV